MSRAISLKINEDVFSETESILKTLHVPRNSYINRAIAFYNSCMKRNLVKKQYAEESSLVSKESVQVNKEFEALEDELQD
jgi:hypothetical protein